MKIQIVSDLHIEFGNNILDICNCDCDLLIIAGDVYPGPKVINELTQIHKYHVSNPRIIFVPGNHEYYGYSKEYIDHCLDTYDYLRDKVIILNNQSLLMNDIMFFGSTGWWDESNGKIGFSQINALNDFRLIQDIRSANMGVD
jgi:predicted MPP superfamily phosphohydrolase